MNNHDRLMALVVELRLLSRKAKAHGDEHGDTNPLAHYWYGLKVAYDDAADRVDAALSDDEPPTTSAE